MSENKSSPQPPTENLTPVLTRRTFLRGVLAAGAAALFKRHAPPSAPQNPGDYYSDEPRTNPLGKPGSKPISGDRKPEPQMAPSISPEEREEAKVLQKKLEEKYDIKILSYHESPELVKRQCEQTGGIASGSDPTGCEVIPPVWTKEGLEMLDQALEGLPEHFYKNSDPEKKVHFILSKQGCVCHKIENPDIVQLPYDVFSQNNPEYAKAITTHELTHRITPYEFGGAGGNSSVDSQWFQMIYPKIGGSYFKPTQVGKDGLSPIEKLQNLLNTLPKEEQLRFGTEAYDLYRLKYGFERNYPNEFIAVASEMWRRGEGEFQRMFNIVLDKEKVVELQDFIQNTVWQPQSQAA
jgi:hypothetical protein